MKNKFLIFFLISVSLISSIGCSKDNDGTEEQKFLEVSQAEMIFEAKDEKKSFTIQSNAKWDIILEENAWFTVSPISGSGNSEIIVTPSENSGSNLRSALLKVKSEMETKEVEIRQKGVTNTEDNFLQRAEITMDHIFLNMWNDTEKVMYNKYPNENNGRSVATSKLPYDRGFTFLWGFSSVLSAYNAMAQHTKVEGGYDEYFNEYGEDLFQGLDVYDNSDKTPTGYASFGNGHDDRYYDDNVWVGIDLTEMHKHTSENWTLQKAKIVWNFLMSGRDDVLGDGIYWKEGDFSSKNTVSNAPVAVMGVKLYRVNQAEIYLEVAKELYAWTKENLQDPSDYLYWDNIRTEDGSIDKAKYHYNSGQMMQAAVLLYQATSEEKYLKDAQDLAESAYAEFFEDYTSPDGESFRIIKDRHIWFSAVMFRGFIELYNLDRNSKYVDAYEKSLDNAWKYSRDPDSGLFIGSFKGSNENEVSSRKKDILDQGGFAEMFARMYNVKNGIE